MANINGANAALVAAGSKVGIGEYNGHVKVMYDTVTLVGAVQAISDTFTVGAPLPKGARVVDVKALGVSMGTTGIFQLGYSANGVDSADPDAFLVGIDLGGQAALGVPTAAAAGLFKKFSAPTQVIGTWTEATDSADGDAIKVAIFYVVD